MLFRNKIYVLLHDIAGMICIIFFLLLSVPEAILFLSGASGMEDLDETTIERFDRFSSFPLKINSASRSRLLSSGLLSSYQTASLLEYRSRCGDILGITELAAVNGFGERYAEALSHFISFDSRLGPGERNPDSLTVRHDITLRSSVRKDDGADALPAGGIKFNCELSGFGEVNFSARNTFSERAFNLTTFNATCYGNGHIGELTVGDFNARFGQGLIVWSGFAMSGYPSADSFSRKGSGISPSRSFTGGFRGIAAVLEFGGISVSAACDHGKTGILALDFLGKNIHAGLVGNISPEGLRAGLNWRLSIRSLSFYGEAGYDGGAAALAGIDCIPSYGWKASVLAKYTGRTREAALGLDSPFFKATASAVHNPVKGTSRYKLRTELFHCHKAGGLELEPSVRYILSLSPDSAPRRKNDLRAGLRAGLGKFESTIRAESVWSAGNGRLCYLETGYKGSVKVWLRGSLFNISEWDDRIYVYERDAPGNFNVPAYYGKGYSLSAVAGWNGLYLRMSGIRYSRGEKRVLRLEAKLQYRLKF